MSQRNYRDTNRVTQLESGALAGAAILLLSALLTVSKLDLALQLGCLFLAAALPTAIVGVVASNIEELKDPGISFMGASGGLMALALGSILWHFLILASALYSVSVLIGLRFMFQKADQARKRHISAVPASSSVVQVPTVNRQADRATKAVSTETTKSAEPSGADS